MHQHILKKSQVDSPLGPMLAIADDTALYLLEFLDRPALKSEVEKLSFATKSAIISASAEPIDRIKAELTGYFNGDVREFKTPLHVLGTPFQQQAWQALARIPYGETTSYRDQAQAMGKASACRAVANANGANRIAIVIPCHRIIASNGDLGGYKGGISRKAWLLAHEKSNHQMALPA